VALFRRALAGDREARRLFHRAIGILIRPDGYNVKPWLTSPLDIDPEAEPSRRMSASERRDYEPMRQIRLQFDEAASS
jgi:hypothetical protein